MVIKIIKEEPITLSEVKGLLNKPKKGEESTYEQKQTLEYVKEFAKLKGDKARGAVDKIVELGVDRKEAVKIVDLAPEDSREIKLIFSKVHYSINDEVVEKIFEILKSLE